MLFLYDYCLLINSSLEHLYALICLGINLDLSEVVAYFLLSVKKQSSSWCLDLSKRAQFPLLNYSSMSQIFS